MITVTAWDSATPPFYKGWHGERKRFHKEGIKFLFYLIKVTFLYDHVRIEESKKANG